MDNTQKNEKFPFQFFAHFDESLTMKNNFVIW